MRRGRTLFYGGVVGAALGVVLAPRSGESRRAALTRLRLTLRTGRGSLAGFAGTPCSMAGPTSAQAEEAPAAPAGRDAGSSASAGAPS
jgi:hypothetical protein